VTDLIAAWTALRASRETVEAQTAAWRPQDPKMTIDGRPCHPLGYVAVLDDLADREDREGQDHRRDGLRDLAARELSRWLGSQWMALEAFADAGE
jgi:hypothetical protein